MEETVRREEGGKNGSQRRSYEDFVDWQEELGGTDYLRGLVERLLQQVLEAEMTSFLDAPSYKRNSTRQGWRNGYKPRMLKTRVGALELIVPNEAPSERLFAQ